MDGGAWWATVWGRKELDTTERLNCTESFFWASLVAQRLKHRLQCRRPGFDPRVGRIPWRRKWQPTPVFLPGESYGRRSLVGYSPRGSKESDTTEQLHFHFLYN